MASEIRVNKINSRTGVGTITLSPTGVDFTGIATVATLKATTGIVTTLSVTGTTTLNGNLDLQDNDKILVGTGDDLEIYHDGTDTWVDNTQGDLYLRTSGSGDDIIIRSADDVLIQSQASEASVICRGDGQVEIYHNNSKKLETTGVGASVTGTFNVGTGTSITSSSLIVNDVQYPTAGALSNRNLIINGAMQVAQRNTTVTGIGVDDYTSCDRFKHFASLSGQAGRCTATQENITDLAGFNKALKLQVTTTETPGSTESYGLNTRLELQDIKGLAIGASNAVPLTLSFYAKAPTGNGVFCAGIIMPGGGSYIEEVTIGTSWSRHEINIPATTTSSHATTQTNDTHSGMEVQITLMAGSSRNGHGNGTWEADTNNRATSNQSNFYSSTSNNLWITGVQLERGQKATPFELKTHGEELAKCKRYCQAFVADGGEDNYAPLGIGRWYSSTQFQIAIHLPVEMRAIPSIDTDHTTGSGTFFVNTSGAFGGNACNSLGMNERTRNCITLTGTTGDTGQSAGTATTLYSDNADAAKLVLQAEL